MAIGGSGIESVEAMEKKEKARVAACYNFCREAIGGLLTHGPLSLRAAAEQVASKEYVIPGCDQAGRLDGRNKLREGGLRAMFGTEQHPYGIGRFGIDGEQFRWCEA